MSWYHYVAHFFAGAVLTNAFPHLVRGWTGQRFPTPFASPPGRGESSPTVNVLWGSFNLLLFSLFASAGDFAWGATASMGAFGAGVVVASLYLAKHFGEVYEKGGTRSLSK